MLPSPADLLPHSPPMRLIDSLVEVLDDGIVCRAIIGDSFPFLSGSEAEILVCIELVAQAAACHASIDGGEDRPRRGFLVACQDAWFENDVLRIGDELLITARRVRLQGDIATFRREVARGVHTIAKLEISVHKSNAP